MSSYLSKGEEMKLTLDLNCEECKESIEALHKLFQENTTRDNVEIKMKEDLNAHGRHTHDHVIYGYKAWKNK